MSKKILIIITALFFAAMLFLSLFSEKIHNVNLPKVTVSRPETRTFEETFTDKNGENRVTVYGNAALTPQDVIDFESEIATSDVLLLQHEVPEEVNEEAVKLAEYLHKHRINPEQVQEFYPTPGTLSTCMYYTGVDPRDMKPVYVPKNPHEKAMQRALIQYKRPENYDLVKEALLKCGRQDLIGFGKECLIRPPGGHRPSGEYRGENRNKKSGKPTVSKSGKPTTARKEEKPAKPAKRKAGWAKPKAAKTGKPNSKKAANRGK